MIALAILTVFVFIMIWYTISKALKFGREQKGREMLVCIYFFIFLTAVFLLLNLAHLFV